MLCFWFLVCVLLQGQPIPVTQTPPFLRAFPVSSDKVYAQWSGQNARAWYLRVHHDGHLISNAMFRNGTKEHLVMGLEPETTYVITVESFISDKKSSFSSPVQVTTLSRPDPIDIPGGRFGGTGTSTKPEVRSQGSEDSEDSEDREDSEDSEDSAIPNVVKWALIAGGSLVGACFFIFIVFFVMHKAQKKSHSFRIRRNTRTESRKLKKDNSSQDDPKDTRKSPEGCDDADGTKEGYKTTKPGVGGGLGKADTTPSPSPSRQPIQGHVAPPMTSSSLLSVPEQRRGGQGRSTSKVCSGISWGSEFDVLEQEDNIYSNSNSVQSIRKPWQRISSLFSSLKTPRPNQAQAQNEAIYNNHTGVSLVSSQKPTPGMTPPLTRNLSMQTRHHNHQLSPTATTTDHPPESLYSNSAPTHHHYNTSPHPQSNSVHRQHHQGSWNRGHGLDQVITPPTSHSNSSTGGNKGCYSNSSVTVQDYNTSPHPQSNSVHHQGSWNRGHGLDQVITPPTSHSNSSTGGNKGCYSNSSVTVQDYNTSPHPQSNSVHHQGSWNRGHGLDQVITPPTSHSDSSTGGNEGCYSNSSVTVQDQNAVYICMSR